MEMIDLVNKRIIVTGASSGIGRCSAKVLSHFGATILLVARNEENLKMTKEQLDGDDHFVYSCDLSDTSSIEPLFRRICSDVGAIDGLVHCAGVGPSRPLKNTTTEFIQQVLDINFLAFAELVRVFSLKKYHNDKSSIVGVSSIESSIGLPANEAYCGSKGAMDSFINCVTKELYSKNIRVNSVQPGWVKTELAEKYLLEIAGSSEESLSKLQKAVTPDEVAYVIAFLMSDLSSGINGTHIPVMGKQW